METIPLYQLVPEAFLIAIALGLLVAGIVWLCLRLGWLRD